MTHISRRSALRRILIPIAALVALLAISAPGAQAINEYHYGGVALSPYAWEDGPVTEYLIGNVATYEGGGSVSVCERVENWDTSKTQKSCGINGAGNALNVQTWYGDTVTPFIENNSGFTHTIQGYWYELTDTLFSEGRLDGGEELISAKAANGSYPYELAMQPDGNLVVYNRSSHKACWNSGTNGNPGASVSMQADGNLVVYSKAGKALFNTGTYNHPGARVVMQNDGNLVVYSGGTALWASWTVGC